MKSGQDREETLRKKRGKMTIDSLLLRQEYHIPKRSIEKERSRSFLLIPHATEETWEASS